ncbi:MAG: PIN domain-containing protein [Gammaproteobacteria bacterium]|jgi:predicted nucleic acid-binding protein|nr:PIN domain-containing protein [Gammaproteobacteria bacterium]
MMKLLDSNILIYAAQPQYPQVHAFLDHGPFAYSAVTRIEVLGYHRLSEKGASGYAALLATMTELAVSAEVIDRAVEARRQYNLSLGDALIAATALAHRLPLVTHNLRDFERVADLELIDPLQG